MTTSSARARLALGLGVAAAALLALSLLAVLAGASPAAALRALVRGSLGSRAAVGETLARSTALVLSALAAVVAFRAGVLNIGIEGQLLAGAAAAAAVGPALDSVPFAARILLLAAAALAGAAAVLPAAWLAEWRGVPAVLSTILLNLVFAAMNGWLVRGPLRDPAGDYPQSRPLAEAVRFPPLFSGSRATAAILVALVLTVALHVLLVRTPAGLRLRAVGEAPLAARAMGLPHVRIRTLAFLASGGLAGLAGGLEVASVTGRLYDPFGGGAGYSGIAAALLGGTGPLGGAVAAVFFAALGTGGSAVQRDTGVPASLATIVPGVLVLAVLAARARSSRRAS